MSIIETSNTQLFIVGGEGNSPEVKRLKNLAVKLNVRENILFLGSIPQDELVYYYGSSDICVLPSYYESFGLAALEASACGKPVVASKVGGLSSIVLDGKTGYLVNWKCPGPFQEKIEVLLNNELLREHLGRNARIHSESLTWDNSTKKLLKLIKKITSSVTLK
jgi:D-inositol-3-phosphate glycosyltransferase